MKIETSRGCSAAHPLRTDSSNYVKTLLGKTLNLGRISRFSLVKLRALLARANSTCPKVTVTKNLVTPFALDESQI
jgi:hypothetical protein